jgi:hypothetical protein
LSLGPGPSVSAAGIGRSDDRGDLRPAITARAIEGAAVTGELFDLADPRGDVLEGALNEAVFAASLEEVVQGTAPAVYGTPEVFFANTYPSAGLRTLLDEALGRVSGKAPDRSPVIRLETSLGGGKTHNLIALYHAARGALDPMRAMEFMDAGFLPEGPIEQLAVFVGVEWPASRRAPCGAIWRCSSAGRRRTSGCAMTMRT